VGKAKYILGPTRPRFLFLNPVCVAVGVSTAALVTGRLNIFHVFLALAGAVAAHISVNVFNEYTDYKSGLDERTTRTPFSGGTGTLPAHPEVANAALIAGLVAFALTGLIGIYFAFLRGFAIVPLGLLGLVVIAAYTPFITRHPVICLIAPGLGFGVLMVMGTHFVLTGGYSFPSFVASLVPFFLVSNLLLINQFPDVEADKTVGRRTPPIIWGLHYAAVIYTTFLILAYVTIIAAAAAGILPALSLLGLATIPLAIPVARSTFLYAKDVEKLKPYLGMNVIVVLVTPFLMAVGIFIGR
jgi:1,4-dihydroxy-2-naphthoate octaprenyltransferase